MFPACVLFTLKYCSIDLAVRGTSLKGLIVAGTEHLYQCMNDV